MEFTKSKFQGNTPDVLKEERCEKFSSIHRPLIYQLSDSRSNGGGVKAETKKEVAVYMSVKQFLTRQASIKGYIFSLFLAICIFGFGFYGNAQVNPYALGLRLGGDGSVNGAEISYQRALSSNNRFEFDLGFGGGSGHNRIYLVGIYHWNWNIVNGLNWYLGPGGAVGLHSDRDRSSYINVSLGGQIGIEYNFAGHGTPILLSLDGRPMWDFIGSNSGLGWGAALGIRYVW